MWRIDQICFDEGIAYSPDIFYYLLLIKSDPAFVATEHGEVVGFVLSARDKKRTGQIVTIDVLPSHRKNGIGSELMKLAENSLSGLGIKTVKLQTAVNNEGAIAFYNRLGYSQQGLLKKYYGTNGDAFLFSKEL